jgi:predicted amidohydrolase YtcJ
MYTIWAADYVGREDRLGSLEPGKFADLVVLDRDYMAIPDEEFSEINALLTMVSGKIVYEHESTRTSE